MQKNVFYSSELKWKAVELYKEGFNSVQITQMLGIKNKSQVRTWIRWYRNGEAHRFEQPPGKQYSFNKGVLELTELERLRLRVKQLEMHNELLGKIHGISRK